MLFAAVAAPEPKGWAWFVSQAFGSDETIAYTAEYTWNANQMAHVMMGFALATVWLRLAVARWQRYQNRLAANPPPPGTPPPNLFGRAVRSLDVSVGLLFLLIGLKDVTDYLMDAIAFRSAPVTPNYWPIALDSFTDVSFWYTGMFLAAIILGGLYRKEFGGPVRILIPIIGLVGCFVFWFFWAAPIWLEQKRTFDQSGLPFNYVRLPRQSETDRQARETGGHTVLSDYGRWKDVLKGFRERASAPTRPAQEHYVIVGGTPEERSKVAVGMACEYALALRSVAWKDVEKQMVADFKKRAKELGREREPTDDEIAGMRAEFEALRLRRVKYVSAPAALERPELFREELHRACIEFIVIDDLSASARLSDPSPEAIQQELRKSEQANRPVYLPPTILKTSGLPLDFNQMSRERKKAVIDALPSPAKKTDEPNRDTPDAKRDRDFTDGKRRLEFAKLGALVENHEISTVWVLSGNRGDDPAAPDPEGAKIWRDNRNRWLNDIAELLTPDPARPAERDALTAAARELSRRLDATPTAPDRLSESGVIVWPLKAPPAK